MKKRLIWILSFALLLVCSYYREVLFRSINSIIAGEEFFYAKTTTIPFLMDWSAQELIKLKYILTVGFTFVFMLLSLGGLWFSFKKRVAFFTLSLLYIIMIIVAAIFLLVGFTFLSFSEIYPSLRMMIGLIHNPLPFLFVSIGVYSINQLNKTSIES